MTEKQNVSCGLVNTPLLSLQSLFLTLAPTKVLRLSILYERMGIFPCMLMNRIKSCTKFSSDEQKIPKRKNVQ
jgi:hypothetical protein